MSTESNKPKNGDHKIADIVAGLIQTLSVVAGVVISVLSFNQARESEAVARTAEAQKLKAEAARPFLEMRQQLYLDAAHTAAMIANLRDYSEDEARKARQRFRELYVTELSLVEGFGVETHMRDLAAAADPELLNFTPAQAAAFELSHSLRDSLRKSWGFEAEVVDNP